jgi:hypothetical protein
MRRDASTVVVLPGPVPGEVLAAASRSMNVALIRPEVPEDPAVGDGDALESRPDGAAGFEAEAAKVLAG